MPISEVKITGGSSATAVILAPQLKKKKLLTSVSNAKNTDKNAQTKENEKRLIRPKPATIDLSQCHNESLDLVRLVISLHPNHLVEAKYKLNHHAMHGGTDGADYYERLASLLWTGRAAAKSLENFQRMNMKLGSVATNHFPGADEMCNKNYLSRKLKFMERIFPGEYDFVPKTWVLPQEWEQFRADVIAATPPSNPSSSPNGMDKSPTYIFKPSTGSQGSGIMLAQKLSEIEKIYRLSCVEEGIAFTVQEYIAKPLLLGGLKFDFRIYVLLESLQPLRMHLYKDGLARFCTEEYVEPNPKNLKQSFMHLTNSSLNKNNEEKFKIHTTADLTEDELMTLNRGLISQSVADEHSSARASPLPSAPSTAAPTSTSASRPPSNLPSNIFPPDFNLSSLGFELKEEEQSKRSIRTVLQQLRAEGHDIQDKPFWQSIRNIVEKTIGALCTPLYSNYKIAFPVHRPTPEFPSACFHILGFDILLDSALKPWLLELNCSPSLNIESTLDLVLKKGMLEKALGILGYLGEDKRRKSTRRVSQQQQSSSSPPSGPNSVNPSDQAHSPSPLTISISHPASSSPNSGGGSPAATTASESTSASILPPITQSRSTPASANTTPQFRSLLRHHTSIGGSDSTGNSNRTSPLTLNPPSSSPSGSPPPPTSSSSTSPIIPLIPTFSHRRKSSGMPLTALGLRYVVGPGGTLEVEDKAPPNVTPSVPTTSASPPPPPSPPTEPAVQPIGHDQETVEYMEICPEEDYLRSTGASVSSTTAPPHPLLIFQHPKIQAIFDRYTSGSTTKKLSSSKFMQACVACKIAVAGNSTPVIPKTTTTSSSSPMPKPLSNWPSRPDIDLLFLQHTKFESSGSGSTTFGSTGKMLDYAAFCDILFQIAETKYKHLLHSPTATTMTVVPNMTASPSTTSPIALPPQSPPPLTPSTSFTPMTLLEAFNHFLDSLIVPEELLNKSAADACGPQTSREQAAKVASTQLAFSVLPTPSSSFSLPPPTRSSGHPIRHSRSISSITTSNPTTTSTTASPSTGTRTSVADAPVISPATLAATISTLLAPKDPSTSVFNRLTGVAPPPTSHKSSSVKKRRKEREKEGTYEAFMAAYQQTKHQHK